MNDKIAAKPDVPAQSSAELPAGFFELVVARLSTELRTSFRNLSSRLTSSWNSRPGRRTPSTSGSSAMPSADDLSRVADAVLHRDEPGPRAQ